MYCPISSTNLAVAHVHALGVSRPDDLVVIDHTDCDSILSAHRVGATGSARQPSYLHGHSALSRANFRRLGDKAWLTSGDPAPGHGSTFFSRDLRSRGFPASPS